MNETALPPPRQARRRLQRPRVTSPRNCVATTNTFAMYEVWRRAPDSLIDFLKTL